MAKAWRTLRRELIRGVSGFEVLKEVDMRGAVVEARLSAEVPGRLGAVGGGMTSGLKWMLSGYVLWRSRSICSLSCSLR